MKKKVLLVDEHDDFRKTVKNYLKGHHLDLEIFEANSAKMGVLRASFVKPDIVIMDIGLPNHIGLETARQIIEDLPQCDIIILTLFDVEIFKKAAEKIKVRAYIGKNDVFEELLPAIKECM